jgi:hypothetical protein
MQYALVVHVYMFMLCTRRECIQNAQSGYVIVRPGYLPLSAWLTVASLASLDHPYNNDPGLDSLSPLHNTYSHHNTEHHVPSLGG